VKYIKTIILGGFIIALCFMLSSCKKDNECNHVFKTDTIEATCSAEGQIIEYCELCGYEKDPVVIPINSNNHHPESSEQAKTQNDESKAQVACGAEYDTYGVCTDCKQIVKMGTATKEAHKPGEEETWYELIDDEKHNKCVGYRCTVCNEVIQSMTTKEEEYHNSSVKHETNQQKAIELGICTYFENECSCGHEYTVKLNHNYDAGEYQKKPTCTEGGVLIKTCQNPTCIDKFKEEELSALGHLYADDVKNADCIDRACLRCKENITATGSHTYEYDTDCWDRVCLKCKELIVPKSADHVYADNFTCHNRLCTVCNAPSTIKYATTDHLLAATLNTRQDCTDSSEKYYRQCDICHDQVEFSYDETHSKHSFTVQLVYNSPSCEATGYKLMKCEHCETTEETIISASSHNDELLKDLCVAPWCTTTGKDVYQCTNCKRVTEISIDALGHDYNGDVYTCHDRVCIRCEETLYHSTEHTYQDGVKVCVVCGDSIQIDPPEITYDSVLYKAYANKSGTLNTVFYLNDEVFNGYLNTGLVPGVYVVKARNEDKDIPARNSEFSNELKIIVLNDNSYSISTRNSGGNKIVSVSMDALTVATAFAFEIKCYDANGDIISDKSGNTVFKISVPSADSINSINKSTNIAPTTSKVVITIVAVEEGSYMFKSYTKELEIK